MKNEPALIPCALGTGSGSFSLVTLFILPAGLYFGVKLLGFSPAHFSASIIEAAMPLAITPFALADKYKLNKVFISRAIVLSTILSVASLPFWISILLNKPI